MSRIETNESNHIMRENSNGGSYEYYGDLHARQVINEMDQENQQRDRMLQQLIAGGGVASVTLEGDSNPEVVVANKGVGLQFAAKMGGYLFYTKNGLPIDMDATWEYESRFSPRASTDEDGRLMKSGYVSIGFNFDREYRYYADLAFDGGIWYQAGSGANDASPLYVQCKFGQPCAYVNLDHYNMTGFWIKKWLNPNTAITQSNNYWSYIDYPWPIIRLAGLYLYYAEALNESGADYSAVLPWLDAIRERAGIPDVATSWDEYSVSPGRYKTKEGLREIIHRERAIELAFEGQRFWDLRRWKEAYAQCNQPFCGWNIDGETIEDYYQVTKLFNQTFEIKDYFWPIPKDELIKNTNLVQNYGWK